MSAEETWRRVPGWEAYEVSDAGRVRRTGSAWPLSTSRGPCGFYTLNLSAGSRVASVRVGTLVAAAFIGPRPDGAAVRRLNGDPGDDRASNLAYGSPAEEEADHRARYLRERQAGTLPLRCSNGHAYAEQRQGKRSGTWLFSWGELHCTACHDARAWPASVRAEAVAARRTERTRRRALHRARWRPVLDLAAAAARDARHRAKTSTPAARRASATLARDLAAEARADALAAREAARVVERADRLRQRADRRRAVEAERVARRLRRAALAAERARRRAVARAERDERAATLRALRESASVVGPHAEWARGELERERAWHRAHFAANRERILDRQREWRAVEGQRVNAERRERYADDERYREAVRTRNRDAGARRAAERAVDPVAREEYRRKAREAAARRAAALTPEQKAAKLAARRERQRRRYAEDSAYRARVLAEQRKARTAATG